MEEVEQGVKLKDVEDYILKVFNSPQTQIKEECELCNLEKKTDWYYENDLWLIVICKSCNRPMVVYKQHTMFVPLREIMLIMDKVYELFGDVTIRFKQRKIKNHFHFHIYKNKEEKN